MKICARLPWLYLLTAVLVVASGTIGGQSVTVNADNPNAWPTYGYDLARTGYNPGETSLKPPLRLRWAYKMTASIYSTPAVVSGVAYLPSGQGEIYAVG